MITVQDIEAGLTQHQFCLYYQPKYSLARNSVEGSEGLIRWRQPDGTLRQPGEFIALASRSALIRKISAYVVEELLADLPLLAPPALRQSPLI
jgi:sensor c-di-GMP phosphodiesterase-like protein